MTETADFDIPGETPAYTVASFTLPPDPPQCDLVMKGGVTSGIVYPYTIIELATKFRLRSIGGTSAGAIAAALAAAAEYARQQRNDPSGYLRLEKRCKALPDRLPGLFQPSAGFRMPMAALLWLQKARPAWLAPLLALILVLFVIGGLVGAGLGGAAGRAASVGLTALLVGALGLGAYVGWLILAALPANAARRPATRP